MLKAYAKTFSILILFLAVCMASTDVWSQAEVGFDVRGGLATPVGDFNDPFNLGFGIHGSVYVEFSPVAAAGLGIGFNRFGYDETQAGADINASGGEISLLNICPELRFMVGTEDMPTFSFVIGAGLYRISQADLTLSGFVTPPAPPPDTITLEFDAISKFGINTAGKVVFPVSPIFKIGVEAMYHFVFTEEDDPAASLQVNTSYFDFMAVFAISTGT
ncbi:MAG: outer membrane beta-barrel protein [Candidatus Latescibacteria bacterium]|nr:outer membrane beta-barrel protein [Candidatus Latescibacterota bacterium]NIO57253.1 outer membrane beta-barrel protein [Candidatus Latescibacterota bacterium]